MAQTPTTATTSRVREVTAGFSKSHDVDTYFADDAENDVLPLGQHYQGKEQIKGLFQVFYRDAFSPARAEIQNVIADAENRIGVLEFTFKGKHVGPQLGFPATNRRSSCRWSPSTTSTAIGSARLGFTSTQGLSCVSSACSRGAAGMTSGWQSLNEGEYTPGQARCLAGAFSVAGDP